MDKIKAAEEALAGAKAALESAIAEAFPIGSPVVALIAGHKKECTVVGIIGDKLTLDTGKGRISRHYGNLAA